MKKSGIIIAIIIIVIFAIGTALLVFLNWEKIVRNWKHDVFWDGERNRDILQFAGCHYNKKLVTADDETFSMMWKDSIEKYEFGFEDVSQEVPFCLKARKDGVRKTKQRAENPPQPLDEKQIDEKITKQLDDTQICGKWSCRHLNTEEREEEKERLKNDMANGNILSAYLINVEYAEEALRLVEIYQRKFINREFSAIK